MQLDPVTLGGRSELFFKCKLRRTCRRRVGVTCQTEYVHARVRDLSFASFVRPNSSLRFRCWPRFRGGAHQEKGSLSASSTARLFAFSCGRSGIGFLPFVLLLVSSTLFFFRSLGISRVAFVVTCLLTHRSRDSGENHHFAQSAVGVSLPSLLCYPPCRRYRRCRETTIRFQVKSLDSPLRKIT